MKIVCIGSGNVASHMAGAFKLKGHDLLQVWSRSVANAAELADTVGASPISSLEALDRDADIYLIAVKDDAIASVAQALIGVQGLVLHTSGSTSIAELSRLDNYGVLYPLQTFSKTKAMDFEGVPLCIEAKDAALLQRLKSIAGEVSRVVYEVDSEQRKVLHLAAVFACNFVNHLYNLSEQLLMDNQLSFDMLRPLIMETAIKVQDENPAKVQTGPAVRDDKQTISKHIEMLHSQPHLQEIYQTLSKSIKKSH